MADAFQMREDGHARLALHALDQALAAARHDDVDRAVEAGQHGAHRGTVGGRHELDRMLGKTGRIEARDEAGVDGGGAAMRVGAAAQDDGVARLEAKPAGIGGDVGPALEDDADDAERRAHALDMQAVRPVPFGDDGADRVGKLGNRLQRLRHAFQA